MPNGRIHYYTVRVNADSFVGRKVMAALAQMKHAKGMSYNACFQESVLMMSEGMEQQEARFAVRQKDEEGRKSRFGTTKNPAPNESVEHPIPKAAESTVEKEEEEFSDAEMLSLLGDTYSSDY